MASLTIGNFLLVFHPLYWQFEDRDNEVNEVSREQTPLPELPKFFNFKKSFGFKFLQLLCLHVKVCYRSFSWSQDVLAMSISTLWNCVPSASKHRLWPEAHWNGWIFCYSLWRTQLTSVHCNFSTCTQLLLFVSIHYLCVQKLANL